MNVLVVVAHHDDIEVGAGGTVVRLVEAGHAVTGLVMTHSGYSGIDGEPVRDSQVARADAERAAAILGHELVCLEEDTLDIQVTDENVRSILSVIRDRSIDAVLTHWHGDSHPPHQNVNRMVVHACRRVPTILGFAVNWHIGAQPFAPNIFVALSDEDWERKVAAYHCYESEMAIAGETYLCFHDTSSRIWGIQTGSDRAEGFVAYKMRWDIAAALS